MNPTRPSCLLTRAHHPHARHAVALALLLSAFASSATAEPPADASPPTASQASPPAPAADPASPSTVAAPAAAPAAAAATDSALAAKFAEDEKQRAKEFARRNGYRIVQQDGQILFCRENQGVTGSRVQKQRRCVDRQQAELEATNAREVTDKVGVGFTPQNPVNTPGGG